MFAVISLLSPALTSPHRFSLQVPEKQHGSSQLPRVSHLLTGNQWVMSHSHYLYSFYSKHQQSEMLWTSTTGSKHLQLSIITAGFYHSCWVQTGDKIHKITVCSDQIRYLIPMPCLFQMTHIVSLWSFVFSSFDGKHRVKHKQNKQPPWMEWLASLQSYDPQIPR